MFRATFSRQTNRNVTVTYLDEVCEVYRSNPACSGRLFVSDEAVVVPLYKDNEVIVMKVLFS